MDREISTLSSLSGDKSSRITSSLRGEGMGEGDTTISHILDE
jgi:hypothetical protein